MLCQHRRPRRTITNQQSWSKVLGYFALLPTYKIYQSYMGGLENWTMTSHFKIMRDQIALWQVSQGLLARIDISASPHFFFSQAFVFASSSTDQEKRDCSQLRKKSTLPHFFLFSFLHIILTVSVCAFFVRISVILKQYSEAWESIGKNVNFKVRLDWWTWKCRLAYNLLANEKWEKVYSWPWFNFMQHWLPLKRC